LNTSVKIKTFSNSQILAKQQYITSRKKFGENEISIIFNNQINVQVELSQEQKKERLQLQKNLHIYKKRYEEARAKNKEKSMITNLLKIDDINNQLSKTSSRANRTNKKEFVEFTLSLTNFDDWKNKLDRQKFEKTVNDFMNETFKELKKLSAVAHYDQHSPHVHFLLRMNYVTSWSEYCREKYQVKDTREAYSRINHEFHNYMNLQFELNQMQKNRKYTSLKEYKRYGNRYRRNTSNKGNQLDHQMYLHRLQTQPLDRRVAHRYRHEKRSDEENGRDNKSIQNTKTEIIRRANLQRRNSERIEQNFYERFKLLSSEIDNLRMHVDRENNIQGELGQATNLNAKNMRIIRKESVNTNEVNKMKIFENYKQKYNFKKINKQRM